MVYAHDLKSCGEIRVGSNPTSGIIAHFYTLWYFKKRKEIFDMKKNRKVNCRAVPITAGIIAGESDPLFSTIYVLPEQFFSPPNPAQPEKKLMLAVLEDAISCWQKGQGIGVSTHTRHLAKEAGAWFISKETHWPFGFVRVCEALDLDPDYLRARLFTVSSQNKRTQ